MGTVKCVCRASDITSIMLCEVRYGVRVECRWTPGMINVTDSEQKAERSSRKGGRRRDRKTGEAAPPRALAKAVWPGVTGGKFEPLSDIEVERIHRAALRLLEDVGMSEAPDFMRDRVLEGGGHMTADGRLAFPRALVEDALAGFRRDVVLHGQTKGQELELTPNRVYMGTGGAAPFMIDLETGRYRESTLRDLYDAARIADALENIHFFSRPMTARDMESSRDLDVNTAYACLSGTSKHVFTSISDADNVALIADMCADIAGSSEKFINEPFLSLNTNVVVPPMRFDGDTAAVIEKAALSGIPVFMNTFGQVGASSPASLAGAVMQCVAETLAGMVYGWLVNPRCPMIFGPRPMVTDLRTGAMSGGGGEQAIATAGAIQMANYYELPNSCIAGATDAKIPDAQSGYEKATTLTLAAHAGCNLITQASGMQASLMGCAFESYVIDDDMLGGILRSIRGLEADEDSMVEDVIAHAVRGEGHFLGEADTFARMEADFQYPRIADRTSPEEWEAAGSVDIRDRARDRAREILDTHYPNHLNTNADQALRTRFDIRLPMEAMSPRKGNAP